MKKVTLIAIIAVLSILCFAQTTPWTTSFDYYDLGLDTLFSIYLSPTLTPQAIYNTQDGIIIVANGLIYEQDDTYYVSKNFGFVYKTDFDGNLLWTSCDETTGGTANQNVPHVQIAGGGLLTSSILADGSVVTLQREGIYIRNGSTGEITASVSNQDNHHITLTYIPETNQLCHAVIENSNLYLRYYDASDLQFINERVIYWHLVDGVCETIFLLLQHNGDIYIYGAYYISGERTGAIYVLDPNDNYVLLLELDDGYFCYLTIVDDDSILANMIIPPSITEYTIIHFSPEGELLNSLIVGEENYYQGSCGYFHFEIEGNSFYSNEQLGSGFFQISKRSIADLSLQSHYQLLDEGPIAFCRRGNGFYAVSKFHYDFHEDIVERDMVLYSIDDSQMPIDENELPYIEQALICYPNPFNPTTTIEFTLTEPTMTELSVFNIKGQLVKTLVNQRLQSGVHKVNWDGKDNSNNPTASGIYFFNLKYNNKTVVQKATLLK
ncbi:MAG: T9SS type A sorting domain-containing protein [Candidatus Cloacimonetes bacterium]|nr:T9SS type A sorting domain-containing protein [Candidatus Cloacimonadota bacterium]